MHVQYSIKPKHMRETIETLGTAVTGIEAEIAELEQRVSSLQGAWSGEAALAFKRAMTTGTCHCDA